MSISKEQMWLCPSHGPQGYHRPVRSTPGGKEIDGKMSLEITQEQLVRAELSEVPAQKELFPAPGAVSPLFIAMGAVWMNGRFESTTGVG